MTISQSAAALETAALVSSVPALAGAAQTGPVTVRPEAVSPSWGWAMKRAAFGLGLMISVTALATYLANASIELSAEPAPATIGIGEPAAALLRK